MALDFIAGCIGGCAGVIVGHPLDTIKIHLQTQNFWSPRYKGTIDCFQKLFLQQGVKGLYRGISSPLMGVAGINAIVFGVYGNVQRNLFNTNSLYSHLIAGATAGFLQSFICSPMELVKSRLQISNSSMGSFECLLKIYKKEKFKGIFRGLNLTILREIPAFGSYFFTYELLTRCEGPVSTSTMLAGGGIAGVISWVIVYPVDVIKSRMQCDTIGKYLNSFDCLKQSIKHEGYSFLHRGLSSTIIRAFPVNAATFTVVNWSIRIFDDGEHIIKGFSNMITSLQLSDLESI